MDRKPLLSIIIATKDRQKYAFSAVESIKSLNDDRIEIVIQDNSIDNSLEKMLAIFKPNDRIIFNRTAEPLSFISNFNKAIEISNGEYICIIGDDDGVNSEIIDVVQWCKKNDIDAVSGNLSANYRWEGTGVKDTFFTKMGGGSLSISHFSSMIKEANLENALVEFAKNGCTNYLDFDLPKLYHGIIKKSEIEKIKAKTGSYIRGLSPDIYSSIALACVVKKLLIIDYPLTIPGVCAESGSVKEGQIKKHSKKLEDAPHFRNRGEYKWAVEVPKIYTVQTIWADSGIAALKDLNRLDILTYFNKYNLYANILSADASLKVILQKIIDKEVKEGDFNTSVFKKRVAQIKRKELTKRVIRRLLIILRIKPLVQLDGLKDINAAMHALHTFLNKKNYKILVKLNSLKILR